jgi:hypothetical protein
MLKTDPATPAQGLPRSPAPPSHNGDPLESPTYRFLQRTRRSVSQSLARWRLALAWLQCSATQPAWPSPQPKKTQTQAALFNGCPPPPISQPSRHSAPSPPAFSLLQLHRPPIVRSISDRIRSIALLHTDCSSSSTLRTLRSPVTLKFAQSHTPTRFARANHQATLSVAN